MERAFKKVICKLNLIDFIYLLRNYSRFYPTTSREHNQRHRQHQTRHHHNQFAFAAAPVRHSFENYGQVGYLILSKRRTF